MARLHQIEHSTLEAMPCHSRIEPLKGSFSDAPQRDQTQEGLQPNWDQHALNLDRSADAPESKELGQPPEVVEIKRDQHNNSGISRRKRWSIAALVLGAVVVALALSLGLGLGIGLKEINKSTSPVTSGVSPVVTPTTTAYVDYEFSCYKACS